jgi:hypothetical protein
MEIKLFTYLYLFLSTIHLATRSLPPPRPPCPPIQSADRVWAGRGPTDRRRWRRTPRTTAFVAIDGVGRVPRPSFVGDVQQDEEYLLGGDDRRDSHEDDDDEGGREREVGKEEAMGERPELVGTWDGRGARGDVRVVLEIGCGCGSSCLPILRRYRDEISFSSSSLSYSRDGDDGPVDGRIAPSHRAYRSRDDDDDDVPIALLLACDSSPVAVSTTRRLVVEEADDIVNDDDDNDSHPRRRGRGRRRSMAFEALWPIRA